MSLYFTASYLLHLNIAVNCDTSGSDSTYTETILDDASANNGKIRRIIASGCPNHPNVPINPNYATVRSKDVSIAAYPCFSNQADYSLLCVGLAVGITLNGVSIFSKFAGGQCTAQNDAVQVEGDTFDACSGHGAPDGQYHYHIAPSCLLDQLNDVSNTDSHSPLIGWSYDGFPVYGPHGLNGGLIYGCSHTNGNDSDCVDSCNGHSQHNSDGFKYHYHLLGPIGDLSSRPVSPLPSEDMSPYTIGCLKGVPFDWSIIHGSGNNPQCGESGTLSTYTPVAVEGVTHVYGSSKSPTLAPSNSEIKMVTQYSILISSLIVAIVI